MSVPSLAVVLGGGISGLSSAYYLARTHGSRFQKIIVLEGSSRLGGWVNTTVTDSGSVFEHGPRSIRPAGVVGRNTLELISELRLSNSIIPVQPHHPGAKKRFIYANKQLYQLPSSVKTLLTKQPPFSKPLISYILKEPFIKEQIEDDESVYDFMRKRLGKELADNLIDPLCIGVFAGNARELSAKSCFPMIFNPAREHGSLVKGILFGKKDPVPKNNCDLVQKCRKERWPIYSLRGGLQELTDTLAENLTTHYGVEIYKHMPCVSLEVNNNNTIRVKTRSKQFDADHVISTLPAKNLSEILSAEHSDLAQSLAEINSATVAIVNMEYEGNILPEEGFGYLIPSWEKSKILGVVYDSCTFPNHNRPGPPTTRITCMMGGFWFQEHFGDPDLVHPDHLLSVAIETVKDHLGTSSIPIHSIVNIQRDCIPQYKVGHSKVVDKIESYIEDKRLPLSVTGASYKGVSVNDCIYNSKRTAEQLINAN